MDTRFHVPASWSAVRADDAIEVGDGAVGAEGDSEHPTQRDTMTPNTDKDRRVFMTKGWYPTESDVPMTEDARFDLCGAESQSDAGVVTPL